jgi:hypothetical protein
VEKRIFIVYVAMGIEDGRRPVRFWRCGDHGYLFLHGWGWWFNLG